MSMNFKILLVFTIFALTSCVQDVENKQQETITTDTIKTVSEDTIADYSNIILQDKFKNELKRDTATEMTEAQFSPVYIGETKPEISLTYKTDKIENRIGVWDKYKRPEKDEIIITIDTTRTVGSPMGVWVYYKEPEYRKEIISFPVFIENTCTDTLSIGFGDILPIIIEAKDKNGSWKPIQRPFFYDCGTGLTEFYLAPNQIALTTMKIFDGNFKTKLRLSYDMGDHKIYSNEIIGQINLRQFE